MRHRLLLGMFAASLAVTTSDAQVGAGANALTLGDFVIDPPTLINLGFEWFVEGDDNRNAAIAVSYRRAGDTRWAEALPLLRLQGERIAQGRQLDVTSPNMFAGSVLDLQPDTPYEVRFQVSDPDGVRGERTRIVRVRTRAEPQPAPDGRIFHVYPPGFAGQKQEPSFEGLMCAYNLTCAGTDWATAGRPRVRAGDIILVHAGVYKYNRYEYTNNPAVNRTVPLDGTYYLTADGTPERPIVIKGAGDGDAIFDGAGNFALFDVKAADYTYFEGLTFRNTDIAIWAGTQFAIGAKGLTVKRSRFEDVGAGIFTNYSGSSNFYIADNTFIGRHDPDRVIGWAGAFWEPFNGVDGQQFPPVMRSYVAVKLYGPGHVIAYNYVANFHDGVNIETYGNPDGSAAEGGPAYPPKAYWDRRPVAIDFYNNYMTNFHDNPFEADGGMHNVRIMRNLMINSASHAFCNQPSVGGPTYWIRNIAYHLPGGSTRLTGGSAGVLFYNNTILSETAAQGASNVHWRNNLMLGENTAPAIFSINTYTNYSSSDYNGFRPNPGAPASFQWNSPSSAVAADFSGLTAGPQAPAAARRLELRAFATLAEYSAATRQDQHSILVDYDVFVNVPRLDAQDRARVQKVYKAEEFDFALRPGAAAIDRGIALPTVTTGFTGAAPDLGALERGHALPHYGPRQAAAPERQLVLRAADALGGRDRVMALRTLQIVGYGELAYMNGGGNITGQPDAPQKWQKVLDYTRTIDLEHGRTRVQQRLKMDFVFASTVGQLGLNRTNETLDGDVAYNIGAGFLAAAQSGPAQPQPAGPAAVRQRRVELLAHPITIVRAALDATSTLSNLRREGNLQLVDVTVRQGDTLTLGVNATTNLPAWVSYVGPNVNLGDVTYRTAFAGYVPEKGVLLPTGFATTIDFRNIVQSKLYVDRNIVDAPIDGLSAPASVRAPAAPQGAGPGGATMKPMRVADHVWYMNGNTFFEFDDHITMVEANRTDAALQAILDVVNALVPGKRVTQVIQSHHHFDHSAGLRAAVAQGLTIISRRGNEGIFREMVARPARRFPDALGKNPQPLKFIPVDDHLELKDSTNEIDIYHVVGNYHMADAVIVHVPRSNLLVEADLTTQEWDFNWWGDSLMNNVEYRRIKVDTNLAVHAQRPYPLADVVSAIERQVRNAQAFCRRAADAQFFQPGCPVQYNRALPPAAN